MGKRGNTYTNEKIIKALEETHGMVFLAAQKLGCDHSTISKRAARSPEIKAAIEANRGEMIDVAEVALMAAIQRKESWAIAFALRTVGRHRGYVEKNETVLSGDVAAPVVVNVVYADRK